MPRRLISLRIYYFTCFAAFGAYLPYFPRWLEARGIDGLRMAVIAALLPAMGVIGPPTFGVIADALGLRGALLRIACFGASLGFAIVAFAFATGHPLGFVGLLLAVLCFAFFRSPIVMMADVVTLEQTRATGTIYSRVRLWGSVGFLLAALAVGRLLDLGDPVALPLTIAVALFATLAAAWSLPTRSAIPAVPVIDHARALLKAPDYRVFLLTGLLIQGAHASYDLCFSLHLRDLGRPDLAGIAWAVGIVAEVTLMAFAGPLLERIAAPRLIACAALGGALRWTMIAGVRSPLLLLALSPLHAISFALWWITATHFTRHRAPKEALATAQGLFTAANAVGSVTGMLTWGVLYKRAGGGLTFSVAACVAGVAGALALWWARRAPRAGLSDVPGPFRNSIASPR